MQLQYSIKRSPYLFNILNIDYSAIIEDIWILNLSGYRDGIFNKMLIDLFHELIVKIKDFSD